MDERTHYSSSNRIFEFVSLGLRVLSSKAKYLEKKFDNNLIWAGPESTKDEIKKILENIDNFPSKNALMSIGEKYTWEQEILKLVDRYKKFLTK